METKTPYSLVLQYFNFFELGLFEDLEFLDCAHIGIMLRVVDEVDEFLEIVPMVLHQYQMRVSELFLLDGLLSQIQANALVFFIFLTFDALYDPANILCNIDNLPDYFIAVDIKHIKLTIINNQKTFNKLLFLQNMDLFGIELHPLGVDVHV